ncbi:hypothetical protein G6F22_016557 [Rhizopus arrhizus]|nr:hypothetical protein G6F22_016557 [Rhizopus arrhizus]KAG1212714.1 hypothetical protein G6F68_021817 [Rhizopus microsporus]KAG1244088.1 hypothetical protein G6F65_022004 [Rhizopus arrhizus]
MGTESAGRYGRSPGAGLARPGGPHAGMVAARPAGRFRAGNHDAPGVHRQALHPLRAGVSPGANAYSRLGAVA